MRILLYYNTASSRITCQLSGFDSASGQSACLRSSRTPLHTFVIKRVIPPHYPHSLISARAPFMQSNGRSFNSGMHESLGQYLNPRRFDWIAACMHSSSQLLSVLSPPHITIGHIGERRDRYRLWYWTYLDRELPLTDAELSCYLWEKTFCAREAPVTDLVKYVSCFI